MRLQKRSFDLCLVVGIAAFSLALMIIITNPALAQLTFTERASSAGVTIPDDANGSSVIDFDGDSLEDLVIEGIDRIRMRPVIILYRNNGDGSFADVTSLWPGLNPVAPDLPFGPISWADFDNDGDADVALGVSTGASVELRILQNNRIGLGASSFSQTQTLAFPSGTGPALAAWGDFDNDGDLDIFVGGTGIAGQLLKNQLAESGSVAFADVSGSVGLVALGANAESAHWIDADNDGDLDLFVSNEHRNATLTRALFYRNLLMQSGSAIFEEVAGVVGLPVGSIPSVEGMFGDYDNDGDQDLYVGRGFFTPNSLFRNDLEGGSLGFSEVAAALDVEHPTDGGLSLWGDVDNDGDLDLLAGDTSNEPWVLYRNELVETGPVGFTDITSPAGLTPGDHQNALLFFDMDNDGDLDIFAGFNGEGSNRLFRNNLDGGTWLALKLVGRDSNRSGIGTRIRLVAGGRTQYRQHTVFAGSRVGSRSQRVHFGLGGASIVDELTLYWPSGCVETLTNLPANDLESPLTEVIEGCSACPDPANIDFQDFSAGDCAPPQNSVTVLTQEELDAYMVDFGFDGTHVRNVNVKFNPTGRVVIVSPCEVNLAGNNGFLDIEADEVCIYGRKGVSVAQDASNPDQGISADSILLVSEEGDAGFSQGLSLAGKSITVQALREAKVGIDCSVVVDGPLTLISTGDATSSNAIIRQGSRVTSSSVLLSASRGATIGPDVSLYISGEVIVESSGSAVKSVASIKEGAQVTAGSVRQESGNKATVGKNSTVEVVGNYYMNAGGTCSIDATAVINAGSTSGNCLE